MSSIQAMLIEKYLFTKAPAGPHHNDNWLCIDCKNRLGGYYDFYPYCKDCRVERAYKNKDTPEEAEIEIENIMSGIDRIKKKRNMTNDNL